MISKLVLAMLLLASCGQVKDAVDAPPKQAAPDGSIGAVAADAAWPEAMPDSDNGMPDTTRAPACHANPAYSFASNGRVYRVSAL